MRKEKTFEIDDIVLELKNYAENRHLLSEHYCVFMIQLAENITKYHKGTNEKTEKRPIKAIGAKTSSDASEA
jgi:hypothetical protein